MVLKKIISDMTSEDEDELYDIFHREFWYFLQISGIYVNPSKPYFLIFPFIHFYVMVHHIILVVFTSIHVYPDLFVVFDCLQCLMLLLNILFVLIMLILNRKNLVISQKQILSGLYEYGPTLNVERKKFFAPWIKKIRFFKVVLPVAMGIGQIVIFTSESILDFLTGYKRHTYDNPHINTRALIIVWYPFRTDEGIIFYIVNALQLSTAASVFLVVVQGTIIYNQHTTNICAELSFLMLSIKKLRERTSSLYLIKYGKKHRNITDSDYEDCLYSCFKQNIEHFHKIILFFKAVQTLYSLILLSIFLSCAFLFATAGIGLLSDQTRIGFQIKSAITCILEVGVVAMICWKGEQVRSMSELTRHVLYDFDWYNYSSKRHKTAFLIMQMSTLKPLTLSGAGLIAADYTTFTKIMNSSFSYLNLLLASK